MKELIALIARALVDEPDQVRVREVEGEKITIIEPRVAPGEILE